VSIQERSHERAPRRVGLALSVQRYIHALSGEPSQGLRWDEGNLEKCQKHGVSIDDIEALLSSDPPVAPDPEHSAQEDRFIAIGRNAEGRPDFVAFTFGMKDGQRLIPPVSARYMHKKEIERYETASS
jgi:uncharacterized protein